MDPSKARFLAIDIGAESGRAMLGTLREGRLSMREVRRFPNSPVSLRGHLCWDAMRLRSEISSAITECTDRFGAPASVGIDTWGVDFGLIDRNGHLLRQPFAYRDRLADGMMEDFLREFGKERLYARTGIQFLKFNSVFQLHAIARTKPHLLKDARKILFMPDLLNYFLTGKAMAEFSIASTSQMLDARTRGWAGDVVMAAGIDDALLPQVVMPGFVIGSTTGRNPIKVVSVCSHDTGSAVAAAPGIGEDWAYLSSGTWSLLGIETRSPIINELSLKLNFTNEGGLKGRVRFLKNIMGLWLLQGCARAWSGNNPPDYEALCSAAERATPFTAFVDPDHHTFLNPADMPSTIASFCKRTGQRPPRDKAHVARCILESLALKYAVVIQEINRFKQNPVDSLVIVGGGSRNKLLCDLTASACGIPVSAGPAEATAAGNMLVQAMAAGMLRSPEDIRNTVRRSFRPTLHEPDGDGIWQDAKARFEHIIRASRTF